MQDCMLASGLHPLENPGSASSMVPEERDKSLQNKLNQEPFMLLCSRGETRWRHHVRFSYSVRAGEEREQDFTADPIKPLPQDQRQTRRNQQHIVT